MSRRTFLESMRKEARDRGGNDSGRRTHTALVLEDPWPSTREAIAPLVHEESEMREVRRALNFTASTTTADGATHDMPEGTQPYRTTERAKIPTSPTLRIGTDLYNMGALERLPTDSKVERTPSATRLGSPKAARSPPSSPDAPQQTTYQLDGSASGRSARSSSQQPPTPALNHLEHEVGSETRKGLGTPPSLSPDAVFHLSQDDRGSHGDGPASTAAPSTTPSSARRKGGSGHMRRSSRSMSSTADFHASFDSSFMARRPTSHANPNSSQRRTSLAANSPASQSLRSTTTRQKRSSSLGRIEASLVALQVELATEKRNNINAEQHIMTLNREVEQLRLENARLSRELATAVTAAAHVSTSIHPTLSDSSSDASVAAAKRIEVLEARLGELSRNMETKQQELNTKDERIRLLEHKLADQLLMYPGVGYMGMVPSMSGSMIMGGVPLTIVPSASRNAASGGETTPPQRKPSRTRQGANGSRSDLSVSPSPSRLSRQAEAPDAMMAAPRFGTIRSVVSHSRQASPLDDVEGSRAKSAVRTRNMPGELGSRDGASPQDEKASTRSGPSAPLPLGQAAPPIEKGRRMSVGSGGVRRPTPRQPTLRPRAGSVASRPGSVDRYRNGGGGAALSGNTTASLTAWTRAVVGSRDSSGRRSSHEVVTSGDREDIGGAAAAATTTARSARQGSQRLSQPLVRSGSAGVPRRPSVTRRFSTGSRDEGASRVTRGTDLTSPLHRQSSASGGGGHPMRRSMATLANMGDQRAASPGGAGHNGAAPSMYLNYRPTPRPSSATRSVAQQSIRSGTSARPRPQITYSADTDTSTIKGTTTTVVFRSKPRVGSAINFSLSENPYLRDGAPLLPLQSTVPPSAPETLPSDSLPVPAAPLEPEGNAP